jgi:hypothetical protein
MRRTAEKSVSASLLSATDESVEMFFRHRLECHGSGKAFAGP